MGKNKYVSGFAPLFIVLILVLAIPFFVWGLTNFNLDIRNRAASGEPVPTQVKIKCQNDKSCPTGHVCLGINSGKYCVKPPTPLPVGGHGGLIPNPKPKPTPSSTFITVAGANYVTDGVDDQVEIQQAIDSLGTTGGVVTLSKGTFSLSSSIEVKANVTVQGQGERSVLQSAANLSGQFIRVSGSFSKVASLVIYDGRTTGSYVGTHGIYIWSGNQNRIESVVVDGVHIKRVRVNVDNSDGLTTNFARNIVYRNNTVEDIASSGLVFYKTINSTMENNTIDNIQKSAIVLAMSDDSIVNNNRVSRTGQHGILSTQGNRNTISNNTVKQSGIWQDGKNFCRGITIDGDENRYPNSGHKIINNTIKDAYQGAIELADGVSQTLIDGNTINRTGIGTAPQDGFGIWVGGEYNPNHDITISNNKISNTKESGIYIWNFSQSPVTDGIKIINNDISLSGRSGIHLVDTKNFVISGNKSYNNQHQPTDNSHDDLRLDRVSFGKINGNNFFDNQKIKTQAYGLVFMGLINNVDICGNSFSGNKLKNIYTYPGATLTNVNCL